MSAKCYNGQFVSLQIEVKCYSAWTFQKMAGSQKRPPTTYILFCGKHDGKLRSISRRRNHLNITTLSRYDLAGKVQSYADAGLAMHFFLAVKAPKNSCLITFRDSFTIISYYNLLHQPHIPVFGRSPDRWQSEKSQLRPGS